MKRLIYQVSVANNSNLYRHCIQSVNDYCKKHRIDHFVQREPILRIKPNVFTTNRSKESYEKYGGYLPIYEKENAFSELKNYDQIAIIDADMYIRKYSPNIFHYFEPAYAFGAVCEREMKINDQYKAKIKNYSQMQYATLHKPNIGIDFNPDALGYEFFNMGMILINSEKFAPFLKGQTPKQFVERDEFAQFVDGVGTWKWSTDQTLLNYFIKKYKVPVQHMHWQWNGLFTANTHINECNFVHFFLKDKLPNRGENIEELMRAINQ